MIKNFIDGRVVSITHTYRNSKGTFRSEEMDARAGYFMVRDMLAAAVLKGTKHIVTTFFDDTGKVYYLHSIELKYCSIDALHTFEYKDADGNVIY